MQNFVKNQVNKLNLFKEKHSNKINKVKKLFDLRKRNNILSILGKVVMYAVLIVLSYIVISPLIDVLSKSFMSQEDLINQEVFYLPNNFTINNYVVSIKVLNLWKALFNSIWFSGLLAVLQTLVSAVTAYAFARYNFKGKKILFPRSSYTDWEGFGI